MFLSGADLRTPERRRRDERPAQPGAVGERLDLAPIIQLGILGIVCTLLDLCVPSDEEE